jgi:hypothetical protein
MKRSEVEKLINDITFTPSALAYKEKYKDKYQFLSGISCGLDMEDDVDNTSSTLNDMTSYVYIILDKDKRKDIPLKDILTGKNTYPIIVFINTTSLDLFLRVVKGIYTEPISPTFTGSNNFEPVLVGIDYNPVITSGGGDILSKEESKL